MYETTPALLCDHVAVKLRAFSALYRMLDECPRKGPEWTFLWTTLGPEKDAQHETHTLLNNPANLQYG